MKSNLKETFNGLTGKMTFTCKKHSPEILVVAGVVGVVVSAVMACRATTKLSDILEETEEQLDKVHEYADDESRTDYTKEDAKKDTTIIYTHTALKVVKLYAPAVGLGVLSITSILASNNILRKRNVAITAAYAAVDQSFKDYRNRVVDKFGEEVDKQLLCNIKSQEIEETTVSEKGKEKTVKKTINIADPEAESDYVKYFTRRNRYWENSPEHMEFFFRSQEAYANDRLRVNGHLTLNELFRDLGIEETKAGMVTGWYYDPNDKTVDNYVEIKRSTVCLPDGDGGYEMAYMLEFNVDGNIYDKM